MEDELFPALAGMNRKPPRYDWVFITVPRTRGDEPSWVHFEFMETRMDQMQLMMEQMLEHQQMLQGPTK